MPKMSKHPVTGCRMEQLFGVWMIDIPVFEELRTQVYALVDANKLIELREKAQEEEVDTNHIGYEYKVEDGIGLVNLSGAMTKYETSFTGMLGGTSTVRMKRTIRTMMEDDRVQGAAILGDTPGGNALGMADLANTFRQFGAKKPVLWHNAGSCMSGGYWLASQTHRITAEPNCETGSVGGFMMLSDRSENLKRQGIKVHAVKVGEFKASGAPGTEITDAQLKYFEDRVKDQVVPFYAAVQDGRKFNEAQMNEVIRAKVYESTPALKMGLIDGIMFEEEAIDRFRFDVKSGNVSRGRIEPDKKTPAASRSDAMPLSAQQLTKVKALPGATNVTEENGIDTVIKIAEDSTSAAQTFETQVKEMRQSMPKTVAKGDLDEKISIKNERIDLLVEKGNISKAQGEAYKTALKDDPQAMLTSRVDGKPAPLDVMLTAAALNKTGVASGEKTGEQDDDDAVKASGPKDEDNKKTDTTEVSEKKVVEQGAAQGRKFKKQQLAERGIVEAE